MKDLKTMADDELVREYFKRAFRMQKIEELRKMYISDLATQGLDIIRDESRPLAYAAREAILSRMQNRAPSHVWDGVGPKRDCQLRVKWADGEAEEWIHFVWKDNDASGYNDGEGEYSVTHEGYYNDASTISITQSSDGCMGHSGKFDDISGADFTITHYADLPTIARVVDLTERYRSDADEGAATV